MAFDFPATPSIGQVFGNYIWDGEKWKLQGGQALGAVRYDTAQILTAGQQAQARNNIAAADLTAMAYSGMQINGSMEVSQELGTTGRTTDGYGCDGWQMGHNGTMVNGFGISATSIAAGFTNILYANTGTAQPSLGAGDFMIIFQQIEGYRISRLGWGSANAQSLTISFWSKHVRTGIYSIAIRNGANNRSYVTTYTQAVSNVAQYNTVTIPGDVTGTWPTGNTAGLTITFVNAAGTTFTAPAANVWTAGNYMAAPGQVNGVTATSDQFVITGVVVLPGAQAPTAAQSPNIMRPYDQELATCRRYFEHCIASIWGYQVAGNVLQTTCIFKASKRVRPTLGTVLTWETTANGTAQAASWPTQESCLVGATAVATGTLYFISMEFNADARL